jgi:lipopolysaccharide export system protein LptC
MLDGLRRRSPEMIARFAHRNRSVSIAKRLLPLAAVVLLAALAAAPTLREGPGANRVSSHVQSGVATASRLQGAKYHGVDQHGQPFTLTADTANQLDADRVALRQPAGDITLKSGAWLELRSDNGLFHQKTQELGLLGNVTLYRNDGTTMMADTADIDLKQGNASSASPVQVQGPFGTLNATHGFSLTDRGADVVFHGPATLVLAQAAAPAQ